LNFRDNPDPSIGKVWIKWPAPSTEFLRSTTSARRADSDLNPDVGQEKCE
jgi:hypothetical protein